MKKETMINQLLAIRSLADSMIKELADTEDKGKCKHERLENLTTMGGGPDKYRCLDCGEEIIKEE